MSEEILKALMELFAIIIKQDGGLTEQEREYVHRFLVQQIGVESAEEYFNLFLETATEQKKIDPEKAKNRGTAELDEGKARVNLTSVLDSVKILRIGKKINKTLNQRQKIVVLVRAFELINTEYHLTDQRLEIVKTLSDVFKVSKEEFQSITTFITATDQESIRDDNTLVIYKDPVQIAEDNYLQASGIDKEIFVLRIPSVELYFLRYGGALEVLLNGRPINADVIYLLANGSSIRLPVGLPIYYSDITSQYLADSSSVRLSLEADKLNYTFPGNVKGLQDISFSAEQGNLIGIMGSSGSGKTTLLNVLSGIYKPSAGSIKINDIDITNDGGLLRGVIGYVPQDDLLIEELSVFDNLFYNAKFCFRDLSEKEISEKVDQTLESLGLLEKKDLKVGSVMNKTISGGQRKRLNIALELIREPSVLYLDEPTSGLSSRDSENVLDLLRELTLRGKLIFVVIHQPSSELYKMFDRVIMLDLGGRLVYYGNPVEAVIHFKRIDNQVNSGVGECQICGNVNPEQIFNIIEDRQVDEFGNYTGHRKISPGKWEELYLASDRSNDKSVSKEAPPVNLKVPGWFGQWINYLRRDFVSKISNKQYLIMMLSVSPVLALMLSYIVRYIADPTSHTYIFRENENIPIYIFMALIVSLFLGLIMSAEEIFRDRKILKREKFLHLSRSSYLLAKIINILGLSAIQSIVFILIANSILGITEMGFHYWFALFTTAACANMIGLIISSAFNSAVTIYIIIPLVMIPMMVLSGAMFNFEKLNRNISSVNKVPVIAEVMPTKWAYEALMVRQFKNNRFNINFFEMERKISQANFKSSYLIPELQDRVEVLFDTYAEGGDLMKHQDVLEVLKNEVLREKDSIEGYAFSAEDFSVKAFDGEFAGTLEDFLDDLNDFYLSRYTVTNRKKHRYLDELMEEKREVYFRLLNNHHNESVADQVKKVYEKNQIVESDGRLYQQIDPIYLYPESTRSHFYAPVKLLGGKYFDTYWFNMAFIWFLTILLYGALYFDLLHKLIDASIWKKRIRHRLRA
jgi:ABC transport system ATP-binding/permease protein